MHTSRFRALLPLLLGLVASSELHISVDSNLNGPGSIRTVVEHVVDKLPGQPKFNKQNDAHVEQRDLLAFTRDVLNEPLAKRQLCDPGLGYCANFGGCCPIDNKCCPFGYCLPPGKTCCPSGPCNGDEVCCGVRHCSPVGGACCRDERYYCEPGNSCFLVDGQVVCCTDASCTAHVDNGITSYASTSTTTRTYSHISTRYYYWTITYWYWYYYWTYSIGIEASIVTSSRASTTTVLSVLTTDADAASEYFSSISGTMAFLPPTEATSLEPLAGQTSTKSALPTRTLPTITGPKSIRPNSTMPNSTPPATVSGNGGPSSGAIRTMWPSLDGFTMFLTFGVGVGVLAALL